MSKPECAVYRLENRENPVAAESIIGIIVSLDEFCIVLMRATLASKPEIPGSVLHCEESTQIFRPCADLPVGGGSKGPEGCSVPLSEAAAGTKPDSPFCVTLK